MKTAFVCFYLFFLMAGCGSHYEKKISESMVAVNDFLDSGESGVLLIDQLSSLECLTVSSSLVGRKGVTIRINEDKVDLSDRDSALESVTEYCGQKKSSLSAVEITYLNSD